MDPAMARFRHNPAYANQAHESVTGAVSGLGQVDLFETHGTVPACIAPLSVQAVRQLRVSQRVVAAVRYWMMLQQPFAIARLGHTRSEGMVHRSRSKASD